MIGQILAEASSGDDGGGGLIVVLFIIGGFVSFFLYWIPTLVAFFRSVPNKWSVAVINFLLGWTLIGWAVALSMAVRDKPQTHGQWIPQR
jgi:hypothetical protein